MPTRPLLGVLRLLMLLCLVHPAIAAELATVVVTQTQGSTPYIAEGVVEAVRQSVIAPQVAGRITQLAVKTGDSVNKGQWLVKIDPQQANQQAEANHAQTLAAQAQLDLARREFARQHALFQQKFISQAALDQAEAQLKASQAAARSTLATLGVAHTQTGFFTLTAPYAGRIAELTAEVGEMTQPSKPLLVVYDPQAMRVLANLPQRHLQQGQAGSTVQISLPGFSPQRIPAQAVTILPVADSTSHAVPVRLSLPPLSPPPTPGLFARAEFTLQGTAQPRLWVPRLSVVQRVEVTAVYVVSAQGKAQLRQVRLGREEGDKVEILSGLKAGEAVARDPIAAAAAR